MFPIHATKSVRKPTVPSRPKAHQEDLKEALLTWRRQVHKEARLGVWVPVENLLPASFIDDLAKPKAPTAETIHDTVAALRYEPPRVRSLVNLILNFTPSPRAPKAASKAASAPFAESPNDAPDPHPGILFFSRISVASTLKHLTVSHRS